MSTPSGTHAGFLHAGSNDRGPAVVITTYILLIITSLTTFIRLIDVLKKKRHFNVADGLSIAVNSLAIIQSICVQFAARHGLGKHMSALDAASVATFFKFSYTAQLLAIAAETIAKVSVVRFVCVLSPHNPQHRNNRRWTSTAVLAVCGVFSFLATALQCGATNPWIYDAQRCSAHGVLYAVAGLGILTDFYVAVFFVPNVWRLQMKLLMRVSVAGFFLSRLLACIAGVAKLAVLPHALVAADQSWAQATVFITEQFLMNLSIITANLPALKNFIYGLSPGQNMQVSPGDAKDKLSSYFATVSSHAHASKFFDRILRRGDVEQNIAVPEDGIVRTWEIFMASEGRREEEAHIAHGVPRSGVFDNDHDGPRGE